MALLDVARERRAEVNGRIILSGQRQHELSVGEYLDVASVVILNDFPPEIRQLARDLFDADSKTAYEAALSAIANHAESNGANVDTGSVRGAGPQVRRRNNRSELIPMLDDDEWFTGDADALALRNRVTGERNAGTYKPPEGADQQTPITSPSLDFDAVTADPEGEWLDLGDL